MNTEFDSIAKRIKEKYFLKDSKVGTSDVYFVYLQEEKILEKVVRKGKIVNQKENRYCIVSGDVLEVPNYLCFVNKARADYICEKITVDELRFLI